jgi:hypothetical protein
VRYLGIIVPCVVLLVAAVPVALGARRRRWFALILGVVIGVLALGMISKVSDAAGYVLPWREPHWLHYNGRNYSDPSVCTTRKPQHLHSAGWVYGYFTPSRRLYANTQAPRNPTLVWMQGRNSGCLIEYALSGGP